MEEFDDEMLMRFADGELSGADARNVERAVARDPDLARRLELFVRTRAAASAALSPMLNEPVPPALVSSVEQMIARRRDALQPAHPPASLSRPANDNRWFVTSAAASVAAILGAAITYFAVAPGPASDPATPGGGLAALERPVVGEALATLASGAETDIPGTGRIGVVATFRDASGALCREFTIAPEGGSGHVSVACNAGEGWELRFAMQVPDSGDGYVPASAQEALDVYLESVDAGQPMSGAEEAEALAAL